MVEAFGRALCGEGAPWTPAFTGVCGGGVREVWGAEVPGLFQALKAGRLAPCLRQP